MPDDLLYGISENLTRDDLSGIDKALYDMLADQDGGWEHELARVIAESTAWQRLYSRLVGDGTDIDAEDVLDLAERKANA